jgi:hypothetical protein
LDHRDVVLLEQHGKRRDRVVKRPDGIIPYGQKTQNCFDNRVYGTTIAQASACILPTLSRILDTH